MATRLPVHLKVGKSSRGSRKLKRARANLTGGTSVPARVQAVVDKAIINEKKRNAHYVDLANAAYQLDTTGSVTLIATCAQGASQQQRVGKKGLWKSMQIRGSVYNNTAATINDVAFLIVYDRDPTGSLPAVTAILDSADSRSFNNDSNSERFKIVRRFDFALAGNTTTFLSGASHVDIDTYIDLRSMPVVWGNLATGAIGDIKHGALYLVCVGMNAAGTNAATLACGIRTRFIDLE